MHGNEKIVIITEKKKLYTGNNNDHDNHDYDDEHNDNSNNYNDNDNSGSIIDRNDSNYGFTNSAFPSLHV